VAARLSQGQAEPERKRVLTGEESSSIDPKPGDLAVARLKRAEHACGGPYRDLLQKVRMSCG
jgi:hypothetical protein